MKTVRWLFGVSDVIVIQMPTFIQKSTKPHKRTKKRVSIHRFTADLLATLTLMFFFPFGFVLAAAELELNEQGYFSMPGLDVTVFSDIYPEGHQTGVTVIQHGQRVVANGDLRLSTSPGQWSPVPAAGKHVVDKQTQTISQQMVYPDPSKNGTGFNPIVYPDLNFSYRVRVTPAGDSSFKISVDLTQPLPAKWLGKVGFNLELFPAHLTGKSWLMDQRAGIFPNQPNGPMLKTRDGYLTMPMATGKKLVIAAESELQRMQISSVTNEISLWDGRANHNNGWFIVRSVINSNKTSKVIEWMITPNVITDWQYQPVIQVSQVGYHPQQSKKLIIEQGATDLTPNEATLYRLTANGEQKVISQKVKPWGKFLRYQYFTFDFSSVKKPGMYRVRYRQQESHAFLIDEDVWQRNVWQPTLEYFLPVQMCHMRVEEKYRVWHDHCHHDDAIMAPLNTNHFDGYLSGKTTRTQFSPGDRVPNLNKGGWHDAGDYDLRVESQMGTVWLLSTMVEEFGLNYDATTVDQKNQLVQIHQADGRSDALQQIEHGLLSVIGGYEAMGRLYRGIIVPTRKQYVLLGDAASQTDGRFQPEKNSDIDAQSRTVDKMDDRWVFTEDNPDREFYVAAGLAAASRALRSDNPKLSQKSLAIAEAIYQTAASNTQKRQLSDTSNQVFALSELILTTNEPAYRRALIKLAPFIKDNIAQTGWAVGHALENIENQSFKAQMAVWVKAYQQQVNQQAKNSPYGVPYKPNIWGAGWNIQRFGVQQYFFSKGWPKLTDKASYLNALNFVLGVHPGKNNQSFASGVGANSALVAYGVNRADWSNIPGGVISGTALIRPDLPELKVWPYFWQQTEYVMGGGATNFMFLALAAREHFRVKK